MTMRTLTLFSTLCLTATSAFCAEQPQQIPLWPKGAPGFENRRNEPERAQDYWVGNIHNPSLTVFLPPKEKANGAAVVICPGGGHRQLVYKAEGVEPAQYLNELGVAAFVLKYRLARETNSPYSLEKQPREDGQRAMRLVRSRAAEWNLDENRIGIMGFSAGGEVVSMVTFTSTKGQSDSPDAIDRLDARPNFIMMIYPGPLGIPESIPSSAPPAFLLVANDDKGASGNNVNLLQRYRAAGLPVEAHFYAHGGHGFNLGQRSKLQSVKSWTQRLSDWLADNNILDPKNPLSGTK